MKRLLCAAITAVILAKTAGAPAGVPGDNLNTAPETPDVNTETSLEYVVNSDIPFDGKLAAAFDELSEKNENTVYSPLSVSFVLSMLRDGAGGETLKELDRLLGKSDGEALAKITSDLSALDKTEVNITNSVWLDEGFTVRAEYCDHIKNQYLAESYKVKLSEAEPQVNSYISDKTKGLIENMLADDAFDSAVMALINTIYLDAEWQSPFKAEGTIKRDFTSIDGSVSNIDFMTKNNTTVKVIDTDDAIGAVLPYSDGRLAFAAVMPKDESTEAKELNRKILSETTYKALYDVAEDKPARLFIPKFEIEYTPMLDEALIALGLKTAYSGAADFSGIAEGICLSSVKTKAVIKVDEKGTEAAAVTIGLVKLTSARPAENPVILDFNRPFAYAVFDTQSGTVLFTGEFVRG